MFECYPPNSSGPDHTNYVTVSQSLPGSVPKAQAKNISALIRHEQSQLRRSEGNPRHDLLNFYSQEEDKAVYVVFQGGEYQGFNNRRAMARFIAECRESNPAAILVHRMGAPLDLELVRRLNVKAKDEPEKWIRKREERFKILPGQDLMIRLQFPLPPEDTEQRE